MSKNVSGGPGTLVQTHHSLLITHNFSLKQQFSVGDE
jgi:hypothetical protein